MSAASSAAPVEQKLWCYVKKEPEGADPVEVTVTPAILSSFAQLKQTLQQHPRLAALLRKNYPAGDWELFDERNVKIARTDVSSLIDGTAVVLGYSTDPVGMLRVRNRHVTHYKAMTDTASRFHSSDGKKPARLLFCEFFDNSIEALRRDKVRDGERSRIELYLVYAPARRERQGDLPPAWGGHAPESSKLQFVVVVDQGPGMSKEEIGQFGQLRNETANRRDALDNREYRGEGEMPPCHADGQLGKFGAGSKAAAFFYGKSVRVITRHKEGLQPGDRSTTNNGKVHTCCSLRRVTAMQPPRDRPRDRRVSAIQVYELLLDKDQFEERTQAGKDWFENSTLVRDSAHQTPVDFERCRSAEEDACTYLKALLRKIEERPGTFTAIVISKLKDHDVQRDLKLADFEKVARELRDIYFVYTNNLQKELNRFVEQNNLGGLPKATYEFGRPDIRLNVVPLDSIGGSASRQKPKVYSLRTDAPAAELLPLPEPSYSERNVDGDMAGDRMLRLFQEAAKDTFHFRVKHSMFGCVEGLVLYLPCDDGIERASVVPLHSNSRAVAFWKGRLIPYATMLGWPNFLSNKKAEKDYLPAIKDALQRTVLILFLGSIAQVDETKFTVQEDLALLLNEEEQIEYAQVWDKESQKWQLAVKDLRDRSMVPDSLLGGRGAMTRVGGISLRDTYREWVEEAHEAYDKQVTLQDMERDMERIMDPVTAANSARPGLGLSFPKDTEPAKLLDDLCVKEKSVGFKRMIFGAGSGPLAYDVGKTFKFNLLKTFGGQAGKSFSAEQKERSQHIVGEVVCFFAPKRDVNISAEYRGCAWPSYRISPAAFPNPVPPAVHWPSRNGAPNRFQADLSHPVPPPTA